MARYRLLSPHIIAGVLRSAGEIVDSVDPPTPDMEPLDAAARDRVASMHWFGRGWAQPVTTESLPGGRHSDGSPVLLNRPENLGAPLTLNPPQPRFDREIPHGTHAGWIAARHPPKEYWADWVGSIHPSAPAIPYGTTPGDKGA